MSSFGEKVRSFLFFLIILFIAYASWYFVYTYISSYHRGQDAYQWPTTQGVITKSEAKFEGNFCESGRRREGCRDVYYAILEYSYIVDGEEHTSNNISYTRIASRTIYRTSSAALRSLDAYPVGKTVTVRYSPERPYIAVLELEPRIRFLDYLRPIFDRRTS